MFGNRNLQNLRETVGKPVEFAQCVDQLPQRRTARRTIRGEPKIHRVNQMNGVSKAYGECQASTAGQERTNELFAD